MCGERVETESHLIPECIALALALAQYKSWRRARSVGISGKCGFERTENWFYNKPDPVCDSEKNKLLLDYDFKIQTDHHIEHKLKPDINNWCCRPIRNQHSRQGKRDSRSLITVTWLIRDQTNLELSFISSHSNSNWCAGNSFERTDKGFEMRLRQFLQRITLLAAVRKDSAKSWTLDYIKDWMRVRISILGHRLWPDTQ